MLKTFEARCEHNFSFPKAKVNIDVSIDVRNEAYADVSQVSILWFIYGCFFYTLGKNMPLTSDTVDARPKPSTFEMRQTKSCTIG